MNDAVDLKRLFAFGFVALLLVILFSCNSSPVKEMNDRQATSPTDSLVNSSASAAKDSAYQTGAKLVAANDCLTCHKIDQKSVGPSYDSIAFKYEMNQGNIENLAHKIIVGGYGRWGTVAMTPHPNVSEPDAQEMVKYVLSLRK